MHRVVSLETHHFKNSDLMRRSAFTNAAAVLLHTSALLPSASNLRGTTIPTGYSRNATGFEQSRRSG